MFFAGQLLLAEGDVWVRSSDAACARIAPGGIDTDDLEEELAALLGRRVDVVSGRRG